MNKLKPYQVFFKDIETHAVYELRATNSFYKGKY